MAFFFKNHPSIKYDLLKDGTNRVIQNPLVRFKLKNVLKNRIALYCDRKPGNKSLISYD